MSTRVPPDDPNQERLLRLQRRYEDAVREFKRSIEGERPNVSDLLSTTQAVTEPRPRPASSQSGISGWVTTALQSVTLLAIVACAFWLGQLSTTVSNTSQKLDKLNDGVVGISRDSLSNRLTTIETKLDIIGKAIESGSQPQKKPTSATLNRLAALQYPQSPKDAQ